MSISKAPVFGIELDEDEEDSMGASRFSGERATSVDKLICDWE